MALLTGINRDKIIEAAVLKPVTEQGDGPFFAEIHPWRVSLTVGFSNDGYAIRLHYDFQTEDQALKFYKSLRLTTILS